MANYTKIIETLSYNLKNGGLTAEEFLIVAKTLESIKNGSGVIEYVSSLPSTPEKNKIYFLSTENLAYIAIGDSLLPLNDPSSTTLYATGYNVAGQLATGDVVFHSSPVQEVSGSSWASLSVSNGYLMTGVKNDGTLWYWGGSSESTSFCWMHPDAGTSTPRYSSPVQEPTSATDWRCTQAQIGYELSQADQGGPSHALKTDGSLYMWGYNGPYKLINDLCLNSSAFATPVQERTSTTWCEIYNGVGSLSGIKNDGTLWSWGVNCCGNLGVGDTVIYSTPTQEASSSTNWCLVTGGKNMRWNTDVGGIKTDGTLWTWGQNKCGQGMVNTTISYSSPVQEASSSTNWCKLVINSNVGTATWYGVNIALKTDGTLWGAGDNTNGGSLGTNNTTKYSSPVQEITSSTNWCDVSLANRLLCNNAKTAVGAIKSDGTMWFWGESLQGGRMLNNAAYLPISSPVQEITSATNWYKVFGGQCRFHALTCTAY